MRSLLESLISKVLFSLLLVFSCSATWASSYSRFMERSAGDFSSLCVPVMEKVSKLAVMAFEDALVNKDQSVAFFENQSYSYLYKTSLYKAIAGEGSTKLKNARELFALYEKQMTAGEIIDISDRCFRDFSSLKQIIKTERELVLMHKADDAVASVKSKIDPGFIDTRSAIVINQEEDNALPAKTAVTIDSQEVHDRSRGFQSGLGIDDPVPVSARHYENDGFVDRNSIDRWSYEQYLEFLFLTIAVAFFVGLIICLVPIFIKKINWQRIRCFFAQHVAKLRASQARLES